MLGLGVIGQHVVDALKALGYPVSTWTRTPRNIDGVTAFSGAESFDEFLSHTRILINVLPLTDQTQGILNARTFSKLLPDAYLINMARGGHLIDDDLIQALEQKKLVGALLDVFTVEPLPSEHPFWHHEAIQITPHISGMTIIPETVRQLSEKINALENGEAVSGLVRRDLGY
ncbi:NAD(P)-binding domain-containing protein [Paenalcaligenes niemegkensis]|uniref:NAD(P)-dependent oxidoreductase n=1 Tax=Paenalcaligenes niemegkensis TaxID=2895469 RepID=UPI001EE80F69|nr:NAD(P)-dependent oxidoreductase [Paenalcaligenes niemegkensis]MCQ9616830.1 NAD(P)-binding domain-containing protein [Paenalcaligenes niemegkensis]